MSTAASKTVVASQPFYFPWVGFLEQVRLADVFITVSDFQFVRNGFIHRVQIKIPGDTHWLTIPLHDSRKRKPIDALRIDDSTPWRKTQLTSLELYYHRAPFRDEMLQLASAVINLPTDSAAALVEASMQTVFHYFELDRHCQFVHNRDLQVTGEKSDRVLGLVQAVQGTHYITGHGAANYLDHELMERNGITVEYLDYQRKPYPQLHGPFTPYVSSLDLIANLGQEGKAMICSGTKPWRQFLQERNG
jgi:hypothetical protein